MKDYTDELNYFARNGNLEVVRELIPVSKTKQGNHMPLRWASLYGHLEVIKELIPHSDPEVVEEVVKELIPHSDPEVVEELGL